MTEYREYPDIRSGLPLPVNSERETHFTTLSLGYQSHTSHTDASASRSQGAQRSLLVPLGLSLRLKVPRAFEIREPGRTGLGDSHDDVLTGQNDGEQGTPRGTDHRPGMLPLGEILAAALSRRAGSDAAAAETMYAEPYGE